MINSYQLLKQFPNHIIFRILHNALITLQLRDEMGKEAAELMPHYIKEWQPFALWLTNFMLTYAGDILSNILLGTLPLEPLCNGADVLFSTIIWYLIFYCPLDIAFAIARTSTFRILAMTITAISQVLLIEKGVRSAASMYNNALVPMLIIGTLMGSGAELLKPLASLLINKCQNNKLAYIKLSTNSKLALCITCVYAYELNQKTSLLGLPRQQIHVYMLILLTTFKYMSLICRMEHMIWLLEKRLHYMLFGGLSADLNKFFKRQVTSSTWREKTFDEFV